MHLERLVVQGFKSFAERLEFVFEPGISAIVGPNGSGKSNVVDAIRWALGEQSLHTLRGERTEDIIFSGSDHRRAQGLAEVILVFDNSDGTLAVPYTEVSVTRRAFRSGSSEFLLNGVPCRLRDIQEMFWNTGLGREGYSFIGQGKVDEVLNLRPEERRIFLEQAAGVWKYRQRKKDAAAKLAQIEQDLLRLGDLRTELERQRGPLEEEARRAEVYQTKTRRLKELEIFLGLTEIAQLGEQLVAAEKDLSEQKVKLTALVAERHRGEAQDEEDKLLLVAAESECDELGQAAARIQEELAGVQAGVAELDSVARERAARLEALTARAEELKAREQELAAQAMRARDERASLEAALSTLQRELAAQVAEHKRLEAERQEASRELNDRREETIALLSERAARANALQALDREEHSLKERQARALATGRHSVERAAELRPRIEVTRLDLARREERLAALGTEKAELENDLAQKRAALEEKRRESEECWRHLEKVKAELTTLESLLERYEGYAQGVKAVLRARRPGIHGAVADLLDVPDGLEAAVEAALGGAQQHLVAESDEEAAATIAWLKEKGLGRATFLPLNTVRVALPTAEEARAARDPDALGWAAELVRYDRHHQAAVQHLLGRVLVTKTLDGARRVARGAGYRFKIVTLDGDVVSPGGSMSGGSRREERRSLLLRTRRVRELKAAVQAGEQQLARHKEEVFAAQRELASLEDQLVRARDEVVKEERLVSELRQALAQLEAQLAEIERSGLTWQEEAQALDTNLAALESERTRLLAERAQLDAEAQRSEAETKKWEYKEAELRNAAAAVEEKITRIRLALVAQEEREKQLSLRREELENILVRVRDELKNLEQKARELCAEETTCFLERQQLEANQAALRAEAASLQERLREARSRQSELKAALEERERAARALQKREEVLRERVHEREIVVERLTTEHQAAKRRLFEAHGVPVGTAPPKLELTVAEARIEVERLSAEIAALGQVNLKAPESLAELRERCDFLTQQAQDLTAAKNSLEKMMREINRTVARRLEDTYVLLRANFQQVFKRLFGGGQADLVLTSSEDILTAGLEILAQLPGKKMQPLTLLSGGERALTAIAFLFALLTSHTSSLCVLDEIDAPLDEVNAARFLDYLEEVSRTTQFIVITHRKQAMARAASLYGLSMAASGVSRLVSIQVDEQAV